MKHYNVLDAIAFHGPRYAPEVERAYTLLVQAYLLPRRTQIALTVGSPLTITTWEVKVRRGRFRAQIHQNGDPLWPCVPPHYVEGASELEALAALGEVLAEAGGAERLVARRREVRPTLHRIDAILALLAQAKSDNPYESGHGAVIARARALCGMPWVLKGEWDVRAPDQTLLQTLTVRATSQGAVHVTSENVHGAGTLTLPVEDMARVETRLAHVVNTANALRDLLAAPPDPTEAFLATHEMVPTWGFRVPVRIADEQGLPHGEGDPDQWHAVTAEGDPIAISNTDSTGARVWVLNEVGGPAVHVVPRLFEMPLP